MGTHAEPKARQGEVQPNGHHRNNVIANRTQTYFLMLFMFIPSGQSVPSGRGTGNWAGLLWS